MKQVSGGSPIKVRPVAKGRASRFVGPLPSFYGALARGNLRCVTGRIMFTITMNLTCIPTIIGALYRQREKCDFSLSAVQSCFINSETRGHVIYLLLLHLIYLLHAFVYRVAVHLVDPGFVCFLPRYCFVCPFLLGQVGIRQNGQITLAAMVETTKPESTKNSLRGDRPPCMKGVKLCLCEHRFSRLNFPFLHFTNTCPLPLRP